MVGGLGQPSKEPTNGWARVSLVRGQSAGATWAIDSQYAEARLSVGSAPDAGWCVQGIGVMPVHFELFWDGRSLWIADTRRVGGVAVNGLAIQDWVQLRGRVEVSFGSARMLIETSDSPAQEMASNPGHATRVTLAPELVGDKRGTGSMNIASLAHAPAGQGWDSMPEDALPSEATRIALPPSEQRPSEPPPLDPESTRIAPGLDALPPLGPVPPRAAAPRSAAPPPPPGLMRPRLGGQTAPPAGPSNAGRPVARTISANEMSEHVPEATRIAQGLDLGPPPASSAPVQAGHPDAGGGALGGLAFAAPMAPTATAGPAAGPSGGFAAPPTFDQAHAAQQKPEAPEGGKGKQALPTRTWILLAITVLAAVGLMMMGPSEEQAAPQPGQASGVPGPLPGQQPTQQPPAPSPQPAPPAGQPGSTVAAGGATGSAPTVVGTAPADPTAPIPVPVADPTLAPTGPTEDRQAADLVIAGRWSEALPRYRALAVAHPDRPEYLQMVRILERRLSRLCQGGVGPDGRPCSLGGAP